MTRKFARFGGAAMAATLLVLTACNASDNKSATAASSAASWTEFRDQFLAGYFPLNPTFAVYQGKHEFDGQLP
ncbi:MAG: DUF885 domain-containing protein, partial [Sphingopyxis sp.]